MEEEGQNFVAEQEVLGQAEDADALARAKYHFLDMGRLKYGECTVATFGDLRVLIDGGHSRDFAGQTGIPSIPDQLAKIFSEPPPHRITLLVVTHCHDDHVGCLDQLLANDIIAPEWALVTHPQLGFGRGAADDGSHDDLGSLRTKVLTAALREEDASDLSDDALQDFLDSSGTVEDRYINLVTELKARGVNVIEYEGEALPEELLKQMRPSGMQLLGPSTKQLIACAQQIATTNKEASAQVRHEMSKDELADNVTLYRRIVSEDNTLDGRNPRGSGMNCQSITLAFGPKASRALLAGDMQFTEPGVNDADQEMLALRQAVAAQGPYKLYKTTHHTSHNGQDDEWLEELGNPTLLVHSGGLNDPTHPDPETLRALKKRAGKISFARTDRNGMITVQPWRSPDEAIEVSRGRLNNFADNIRDTAQAAPVSAPAVVRSAPPVPVGPVAKVRQTAALPAAPAAAGAQQGPQIIIVNLPPGPADLTVAGVDIKVRIPGASPAAGRIADVARPIQLGGGRSLPPLLFVTSQERLAANIGSNAAASIVESVVAPHRLLNVDGPLNHVLRAVRDELRGGQFAGVVILGGYDVVPSVAADVLPAGLRRELPTQVVESEQDEFLVWSDELYGDTDEDSIGEFPVSRVPDGSSFELMKATLTNEYSPVRSGFGIRNVQRPFAEKVWELAGGRAPLKVSELFEAAHVRHEDLTGQLHYHMLHGDDSDGREFAGERMGGANLVAFTVDNVPRSFTGVVLSGCCWGALTVQEKASDVDEGAAVTPRAAADSIALSYLTAGANAFIGCTGAHYSGPATDRKDNLALEFHEMVVTNLVQGRQPPARALHEARVQFGAKLAHDATMEPLALARRLKNRSQFTCLGLGW